MTDRRTLGILAEFDGVASLLNAAEKCRDAGFEEWDAHSPFAIHGMNEAMGIKRSYIGWICAVAATAGTVGMMGLQGWTSAVDYKLVISGKPFFSYQAFVPITFAVAVLSAAFAALLGFMALMKFRYHHPLFNSESFTRFSDDAFFISVDAADPKFDALKTAEFFKSIGAVKVEQVEEFA